MLHNRRPVDVLFPKINKGFFSLGHGVCGLGRFSARSLVAVAIFMATGIATAVVMRHVLGVPS